ncbi:MAG: energy-coupling factor ABC transporter permease, partial [Planctomycetes bacterium]|nr:energy-coupling factor ABC transporter permease [Planctomycetota bacterium]
MHIQDGTLSTPVCIAAGAVSLGAVGYCLRRMGEKDSIADRTVPLTGMMASLVFAGQMINFPIGLPVSGHLMGGVLAATILGPWAGCMAISLVLFAQWALFSDGGLIALGANVLHMAVIGSIGGYAVMSTARKLLGGGFKGTVAGSVVAAWLSVLAASALFCAELRLSWHSTDLQFGSVFAMMVSLHALIGIGEALITGFVLSVVLQQRPDLIYEVETAPAATTRVNEAGRFLGAGLVAALAVAACVSPLASAMPDGLAAGAEEVTLHASDGTLAVVLGDDDHMPA